jgi:hypothetical protein
MHNILAKTASTKSLLSGMLRGASVHIIESDVAKQK